MTPVTYHTPVLLKESVDGLQIRPDGIYVDVTFGGGGHSREILSRLGKDGRLYGFDQDADALANRPDDGRFTFVRSNFRYLNNWMRYYGVDHIDGLLADLGVSSHHLDDERRGFSFRYDAPLDMRMNNRGGRTAAEFLAEADEKRIADVFYYYGELRQARRLAAAIVKARATAPVGTTQELAELAGPLLPAGREKKEMAKVFQALRIEINQEMAALQEMLSAAVGLLARGGRLSVITYHSLEDRIVKNMMKAGNAEGRMEQDFFGNAAAPLKPVSGKPVLPSEEEIEANPRSRSAKLRIAEKK